MTHISVISIIDSFSGSFQATHPMCSVLLVADAFKWMIMEPGVPDFLSSEVLSTVVMGPRVPYFLSSEVISTVVLEPGVPDFLSSEVLSTAVLGPESLLSTCLPQSLS